MRAFNRWTFFENQDLNELIFDDINNEKTDLTRKPTESDWRKHTKKLMNSKRK